MNVSSVWRGKRAGAAEERNGETRVRAAAYLCTRKREERTAEDQTKRGIAPPHPLSHHTVPPHPLSHRTVPPHPLSHRTVPPHPLSHRIVPPHPLSRRTVPPHP
ncbi:hypothetical protein ANANG_G00236520, partial [Anguilla anguilla]